MAQWAMGTTFQREGATPDTFEDIAEITSITGPGLTLDTADSTALDAEDGWEEVTGTILRTGEVTLEMNFLPSDTVQNSLITDMTARATKKYRLVFPDENSTTWEFSGIVTGFEPGGMTPDGVLTATVTIKPIGKPNLNVVNVAG